MQVHEKKIKLLAKGKALAKLIDGWSTVIRCLDDEGNTVAKVISPRFLDFLLDTYDCYQTLTRNPEFTEARQENNDLRDQVKYLRKAVIGLLKERGDHVAVPDKVMQALNSTSGFFAKITPNAEVLLEDDEKENENWRGEDYNEEGQKKSSFK